VKKTCSEKAGGKSQEAGMIGNQEKGQKKQGRTIQKETGHLRISRVGKKRENHNPTSGGQGYRGGKHANRKNGSHSESGPMEFY